MDSIPNDIFFESVESLLSEGQRVKITVRGTSMRPFFRSGIDYVIVVPVKKSEVILEDEAVIKHDLQAEKFKNKNTSKSEDRLTIRRRDIVLFRNEGTGDVLLHRIVHIYGTLLLIRGDGCYGSYERATVSDVIGIVVEGTCFGGHHFIASSFNWRFMSKFWTATYRLRRWVSGIFHLVRR